MPASSTITGPDSPASQGSSTVPCASRSGSGAATPVRKISAHEFERGGLLRPLVNTIDGTPTFLSPSNELSSVVCGSSGSSGEPGICNQVAGCDGGTANRSLRRSRNELQHLDEKELIFELVKDICNDLDVRSLCHKILQNVSMLLRADRGSLFLVQGNSGGCAGVEGRYLVSKLFDVCSKSTLQEMEKREEIRIAWGTGIVGFVAESGEPVNIPDAYKVN
ncbi:hypothetical protein J437_LFUL018909 [Ladona fulva]|uniref:GAF domain-containing protein n=1 Tax=Ladona fulva TaxID=123851 RepID=A0A8K0KSH0_LADFU|nr:hypothetical protein J437_LFUL018909 [Ladona fulva]